VNAEGEMSSRHNLLKEYEMSLNFSSLSLLELRNRGSKNGIVRRMGEGIVSNNISSCSVSVVILGSKIKIQENLPRTFVFMGSRHRRETEHSLGV
jgi:hypothetical protein